MRAFLTHDKTTFHASCIFNSSRMKGFPLTDLFFFIAGSQRRDRQRFFRSIVGIVLPGIDLALSFYVNSRSWRELTVIWTMRLREIYMRLSSTLPSNRPFPDSQESTGNSISEQNEFFARVFPASEGNTEKRVRDTHYTGCLV